MRFLAVAALVLLAGCGDVPRARPAPSGVTAASGGGEQALGVAPKGTTNMPYR